MKTIYTDVWHLTLSTILIIALSGCASPPKPLYYWGDYQEQVYNRLQGKTSPEEQITVLEQNTQQARSDGAALPPGYHAHLGMLYAEIGKLDQVRQQLETEKTLFSESAVFMDFLMRKFQK